MRLQKCNINGKLFYIEVLNTFEEKLNHILDTATDVEMRDFNLNELVSGTLKDACIAQAGAKKYDVESFAELK